MKFFSKGILAAVVVVALLTSLGLAQNPTTFQVNMNVQQFIGNFDPGANDIVVVRGSFNEWSGNDDVFTLDDTLYVCEVEIAATGGIEYKFVIVPGDGGGDVWEGVANRTYDVPAGGGIIDPVYFNDMGWEFTDIEVLMRVDMQVQILNGGFDPATDWVIARGAHESLGNWGGTGCGQLIQETGTDIYSKWVEFDQLSVGQTIEYKFVILEDGNPDLATWEQSDNRSFSPDGSEPDNLPPPSGNGYGEIQPDVVYFSDISPDDIITSDVLVNFHVDVRPAFRKIADPDSFIVDVQTGDTVWTVDEVDVAGFFNGWPWGGFDPAHMLNDDGTAPDETAGDSIYAVGVQFFAGDPIELIYKYGINGYDVEAGFAQNHSVILDDANPIFDIDPPDIFGSQGDLYDPWIGVIEHPVAYPPESFNLLQNYPNPFNPSTLITFQLPQASAVNLKVFNINGQEVYNYTSNNLNPGEYHIPFDGTNLASGVYVYQLLAGDYKATHKMVLMK
ncbi:T9SS type A sorting domain-containing protein [bacterium]|nr:T9SS type A sorting domain-containing protein [bacterium]